MKVSFQCAQCGARYSAESDDAGKKSICQKCGAAMTVPSSRGANVHATSNPDEIKSRDHKKFSEKFAFVVLALGIILLVGSILYTHQRLKYISFVEQKFLKNIDEDIESIQQRIEESKVNLGKYDSGLLNTLLATRLAILNASLDLLTQRKLGKKYNVEIDYDGMQRHYKDENHKKELLQKLEKELEAQQTELIKNQTKSEMYAGGLLKALFETSVATNQIGIALLELKKLAIEYDIPLFLSFQPGADSAIVDTNRIKSNYTKQLSSPSLSFTESKPTVEIIDIDSKITESNNSWWKYAWRLTIKNSGDTPVSLSATVEFQDKDGFIIDQDSEYNLYVPAQKSKTFTGYILIDADVAGNVFNVVAKVK